jgi:hypothetical protein
MMSYLKSLVVGGPKAPAQRNEKLLPGDISLIMSTDDFEEIITTNLDDIVTLYDLKKSDKPLGNGH